MKATVIPVPAVDPELDPALEAEVYLEPPELEARLDIEEDQAPAIR